jgi:hypothetical protein
VTVATTFVMSGERPTNGTFTTSTCRPATVTIDWSCVALAALHEPPYVQILAEAPVGLRAELVAGLRRRLGGGRGRDEARQRDP